MTDTSNPKSTQNPIPLETSKTTPLPQSSMESATTKVSNFVITKQFVLLVLVLLLIYYMYKDYYKVKPGPMIADLPAKPPTPPGGAPTNASPPPKTDKFVAGEEGFTDGITNIPDYSWNDVITQTEIDPGVMENHAAFVNDVRRFSSGANFTSVADDNNNQAYTNFIGLNRPQHVNIGADARQQPDVDESVLKRNTYLRWGSNTAPLW